MRKLAKLISLSVALGCIGASVSAADSATTTPVAQGQATPGADNTRMNARDRSGATQTPQKQSSRTEDRKVLAAVRRAVVRDKTLSTSAHNVKIVAKDGVVTLRGPVRSEDEKGKVANLAQQVAGVTAVENQIDVKTR